MTNIITYEKMKNLYNDFKSNMPDGDFERYYKELNFMKNLIEIAKKEGINENLNDYEKIKNNALIKLKELGYNFE